jgi:hypothetical protein
MGTQYAVFSPRLVSEGIFETKSMSSPAQLRNIPSHLSSAFVSFDTFFRGADNAACIRIEAHLVENLKAKLLIGMDIMGHEGFRLDFDAKTLKIPSCMGMAGVLNCGRM